MCRQLNVETGGGILNIGGGVLPRVWGKTIFLMKHLYFTLEHTCGIGNCVMKFAGLNVVIACTDVMLSCLYVMSSICGSSSQTGWHCNRLASLGPAVCCPVSVSVWLCAVWSQSPSGCVLSGLSLGPAVCCLVSVSVWLCAVWSQSRSGYVLSGHCCHPCAAVRGSPCCRARAARCGRAGRLRADRRGRPPTWPPPLPPTCRPSGTTSASCSRSATPGWPTRCRAAPAWPPHCVCQRALWTSWSTTWPPPTSTATPTADIPRR